MSRQRESRYSPSNSRSGSVKFLRTLRSIAIGVLSLVLCLQVSATNAAEGGSVQITGLDISVLADSVGSVSTSHRVILSGTFTNTSESAIENLELNLVSTPTIKSRTELGELLADPTSARALKASDKSAVLRNIAPGATKNWQITFRGEEILGLDAAGVYGLGVKPNESDEATVVTTPWYFNADIKPTNVAFVLQLATLNNHLANGEVTNPKNDLNEAQRLLNLISNQSVSKISWLQDSALRTWVSQLTASTDSQIPLALNTALDGLAPTAAYLPYGHTDLTALSLANQQRDLLDAINFSRSLALGKPIFYAPVQGVSDRKTVAALNEQGVRTIVSNEFLRSNERETTSAVATSASNPVLVHDLAASRCLSGVDENDAAFFKSVTCIKSEIGMMTAESPQSPRSIIVLSPPDWKISSERLTSLISELSDRNWMQLANLDLVAASEPTQNFVSLVDDYQNQLTRPTIRIANKLRSETEILSSLFVDKELAAGFDTSRILGFSDLWGSEADAARYLSGNLEILDTYLGAVSLQVSSRITTPEENSEIPITIVNESDREVSVSIDLTSTATSRFSAAPSELIQVGSGQRITVPVAITLRGAGVVEVQAQLIAPNGERFGEVENMQISSAAYSQFARTLVWGAFGLLVLLALSNFVKRRKDKRSVKHPES